MKLSLQCGTKENDKEDEESSLSFHGVVISDSDDFNLVKKVAAEKGIVTDAKPEVLNLKIESKVADAQEQDTDASGKYKWCCVQ